MQKLNSNHIEEVQQQVKLLKVCYVVLIVTALVDCLLLLSYLTFPSIELVILGILFILPGYKLYYSSLINETIYDIQWEYSYSITITMDKRRKGED